MAAEALHAGASGFVHTGLSPERIALALSLALEGEVVTMKGLILNNFYPNPGTTRG